MQSYLLFKTTFIQFYNDVKFKKIIFTFKLPFLLQVLPTNKNCTTWHMISLFK